MNRLWNTDGLSRKEYEQRKEQTPPCAVLESDFPALLARMAGMMQGVRYFGPGNRQEGVFYDLFRFQPLVILTEIRQLDLAGLNRLFRQKYEAGSADLWQLPHKLARKLDEWDRRLAYNRELLLTSALRTRPAVSSVEGTEREICRKEFYSLLETVRKLQGCYDIYLEEIRTDGRNDPALAVMEVFLRNYAGITTRFNMRWVEIPSFYSEQILGGSSRHPVADRTWLTLAKGTGEQDVILGKGTAFVAGRNEDGTPFCYRSMEEIVVGGMEIARVYSCCLERDSMRFPASRLGYVTAILGNELQVSSPECPQQLFRGKDCRFEPMGLGVESPMLVLREGVRNVTLSFRLTTESAAFFDSLVADVAGAKQIASGEIIFKLLNDAFYLKISTEDGWATISDYQLSYEDNCCLQLVFRLNGNFPATGVCGKKSHGCDSVFPVLKVLMNREAWLFPYSWARQVWFDEMTLRTDVTGVTSVKLYNPGGEQDCSVPVYPFGVQPERGAWFVFGNYEMARKPLRTVRLKCCWLQIPEGSEGLFGHYRGYNEGINNNSFRVRTEWLSGKKWQSAPGNSQSLFCGEKGQLLPSVGALCGCSELNCRMAEEYIPEEIPDEDRFVYGRAGSGFFRVVLETPEIGFGHSAYRQLFTDLMIQNSHRRRPLPLPALPLSPLAEGWELCYSAEDKTVFAPGRQRTVTRVYHFSPLEAAEGVAVACDRPVPLADGFLSAGNLLLGFRGAEGYELIRLFVDVAPLQKEIDYRDEGRSEGLGAEWYMNNGKKWVKLDTGATRRDSTSGLMNSGVIEIVLPETVRTEWLDPEGLFWLCAAFAEDVPGRPAVRGFHMNAVEVVADAATMAGHPESLSGLPEATITSSERDLPGIARICQIGRGTGGLIPGDSGDIRLRLADRIAHRNRAVTPVDYERLVMNRFPQVMKVKCLPGLDTKGLGRKGVVTLVISPHPSGHGWPLASHLLLLEIEQFLQSCMDVSVLADAVNPVYEEMTVRCRVKLMAGTSWGETVRRLAGKLDGVIAPWVREDGIPVFGHRFSLQALQNVILDDSGVLALEGLSVLHVTAEGQQVYRLNEYCAGENGSGLIGSSRPWCVAVPAVCQLIGAGDGEGWEESAGVGCLQIGNTLVIK